VFNATFSSISAISWRPVLVVEEAGDKYDVPFVKSALNFTVLAQKLLLVN
jgi:hypothetical protein